MTLKNINDIDNLLREMTVDEKLSMLVGGQGFSSLAIEKYGITEMSMCDSHNGINLMQKVADIVGQIMKKVAGEGKVFAKNEIIGHLFAIGSALGGTMDSTARLLRGRVTEEEFEKMPEDTRIFARNFVEMLPEVLPGGICPTCYPAGMNMGATWDRELMKEVGRKVGQEALSYNIDILLAPTINIQRDPKCGRWFESYSEDPYLMGEMVVPYIEGAQANGVMTTVKHYACNNQETLRHEIDEIISERALREIYLPAFKKATITAKSKCLMTAYNSVNGEFASENTHLLTDILRNEWGYDGLVISDWNGVYNKVNALKAGNNLEMPGPNSQEVLKKALENGEITIDVIDDNLRYILWAVINSNKFNHIDKTTANLDMAENAKFSEKMAADSMILLKNNLILPLATSEKIAVIGEYAKTTLACGTGSSGIISDHVISILDGIKRDFKQAIFCDDVEQIENADIILAVIGENVGEGADRKTLAIDSAQSEMLKDIIKTKKDRKLVVALNTPAPVEISEFIENIDALIYVGFAGQEVGYAFSDIISGKVNPSAKTTSSYPKRYIDTPTYLNFPGEFLQHVYGEGIYVGYRYYDKKQVETLFPFGHGLSYTNFEYCDIVFDKDFLDLAIGQTLKVKVLVKNTGKIDGKEVVQVYVKDEVSTIDRPIKELKGFAKVDLKAGEQKWVEIELDREAFCFFDTSLGKFVVEPGIFNIAVGGSSEDLPLIKSIEVLSENPYTKSLKTPIKDIIEDKETLEKVASVLPLNFFKIGGIQVELIYHPELSIGECIEKYMAAEYKLTTEQVDDYKCKVMDMLSL